MALIVPKIPRHNFTVDNWGTNPAVTPGTAVTPGASGAEGTYTEIIADTSVTEDIYGIHLTVLAGTAPVAPKNMFLDIGYDPAGGTSYGDLLVNIVCGSLPVATVTPGAKQWYFPIFIPSGSAIAGRFRGVSGTAGSMRLCAKLYGRRAAPEILPVGGFSETIGVTETAAVDATAFTPGNAADGTWASLGATARDLWWWQLGYQIDNGTITAEYTFIDLGYGDGTAGGTTTIYRMMHAGTTGETVGPVIDESVNPVAAYCPLPAGTTMYVRGRCNNAPDTGYQAGVVAVG